MESLRILIVLLGLSLCALVTWLIWPGYTVGDRFYSYPVTGPLIATITGIWLVILSVTFIVVKKMKRK